MMTALPALTIALVVVLAVAGIAAAGKAKPLATFRAEAMDQFDAWLAGDSARQLGLSAADCEIAKREESIGNDEGVVTSYTLTLFLRASTGRYVMFKSTPTGPYVKLVEPSVAKAVLKDRYVPR